MSELGKKNNYQIKQNIIAHDKVSSRYEDIHDEIFNPIEQKRLRHFISKCVNNLQKDCDLSEVKALDFGCGSGNITKYLIEFGVYTFSADVSENFLKLIVNNFKSTGLSKAVKLNGESLSEFEDSTFNFIVAYSVLHHVPNYLSLVKEFCRVLKKGGLIYIDHEVSEDYWCQSDLYKEFIEKATPRKSVLKKFLNLLNPRWVINKIQVIINPRYQSEGDIHVWPDDHIEWKKIETLLEENGCEIFFSDKYLLYKNNYKVSLYESYKNRCNDMKMIVAKKVI